MNILSRLSIAKKQTEEYILSIKDLIMLLHHAVIKHLENIANYCTQSQGVGAIECTNLLKI